jgi:hypothetical protein
MGILAISFSIVQLLDAEHPKIWGAVILGGYGLAGLILTFFVVLPFLSSPAVQDLPVLMITAVGPVLGASGGIWGLFWKNSSISQEVGPSKSRFWDLLRKKWLLVLLLILLALETSILILIAVEWSLGNQNFPPITLMAPVETRCTFLTATIQSQSTANRTVLFDCSGSSVRGPALKMSVFTGGGSVASLPMFKLPQGYQKLWLIDGGSGNCTSADRIPITNGVAVGLGAYWQPPTYDYCASISPAGPLAGFAIRWSLAPA